jgi:alkanesulfonate monooxygenase SsuD/methylene tetrahydromethanopterin reductase-like flavin-dependent oxidoreductase (luciferase family)
MPLQLHVGAPASASLAEQVAFIVRAESLGFDGVGLAEDARFGDPFETLAAAADQTSRIWLYPTVTNPITRTPSQQVTLIRRVAERAPGRVKLAIGAGDAALVASGHKPARLATLRKAVLDIREALGDGSIALFDRIPAGTPPALLPPPVAMAASGARTLETAAEVADEVLVTSGLGLDARTAVTQAIAEGAMRSRRRARDVPVTYYTLVSIDDDREAAIERSRSWIHFWLQRGMFKLSLKAMGLPVPPFATPADLPAGFLRTAANTLVLAGTPHEVAAKVSRLEEDGVRTLFCMLPGGPKQHAVGLDLLATHLLPAARA